MENIDFVVAYKVDDKDCYEWLCSKCERICAKKDVRRGDNVRCACAHEMMVNEIGTLVDALAEALQMRKKKTLAGHTVYLSDPETRVYGKKGIVD